MFLNPRQNTMMNYVSGSWVSYIRRTTYMHTILIKISNGLSPPEKFTSYSFIFHSLVSVARIDNNLPGNWYYLCPPVRLQPNQRFKLEQTERDIDQRQQQQHLRRHEPLNDHVTSSVRPPACPPGDVPDPMKAIKFILTAPRLNCFASVAVR